ncbi:polysaccharide deacetylase family protein [Desulfitobacterium metallireducens]|uniref:Polysaccharide deacetylase n=1 Tax=Desulfitobacterium metallireducens DSM 15288 TaxID=871968 RepID=W0E9F8_9FIRM|nr:polysaccharide deacetylase family protein [Desulfitobacterium metallireducens]AHF07510.1 polysaccharide deacetylase [Desulfitobacterium metallireducens DSM 15288]
MYLYFKLSHRGLKILALVFVLFLGFFVEQKVVATLASVPEPIEQIKTEEKVIALTINVDWGEEYIPGLLDALDKGQAKATFFLTGRWANKNPELVKDILARGHEIENHGYSHPHPDRLSVAANEQEIIKTEKIVQELTGQKTRYYAPPYGEKGVSGLKAAQNLDYQTILWTLDTVDWRPESSPDLIAQRIVNPSVRFGVKPKKEGAIVLMHPKANTVKALPKILNELNNQGFRMIKLSELITLNSVGNTTS